MALQRFVWSKGFFISNAAGLATKSAPAKPYKSCSELWQRGTLRFQTDLLRLLNSVTQEACWIRFLFIFFPHHKLTQAREQ
jgi:hypothetical protein